MWARVVEVMLAFFLAITPFIFHLEAKELFWWLNTYCASTLVVCFALISFASKFSKMHLFSILVGLWLTISAYANFPAPASPFLQSNFLLGILLSMIAIVPCHSHLSPPSWRDY